MNIDSAAAIPRALLPASRAELIAMAAIDHDASLVRVDDEHIARTPWPVGELQPMTIHLDGRVATRPEGALQFLLLMASINYRFWRLTAGRLSRYSCMGETGARALWLAVEAAWGADEVSPDGLASRLAQRGVQGLFGDIPDADSRATILTEVLTGDIGALSTALVATILERRAVTVNDAAALAAALPMSFADPYLKKSQLALSMFAAHLRGIGQAIDTSDLTAFADYQVPRVLRAIGVLRYATGLASKVDSGIPLAPCSPEERAIRAATVLACEKIALHCKTSAADVDNLLWHAQHLAKDSMFHLTPTTWY